MSMVNNIRIYRYLFKITIVGFNSIFCHTWSNESNKINLNKNNREQRTDNNIKLKFNSSNVLNKEMQLNLYS